MGSFIHNYSCVLGLCILYMYSMHGYKFTVLKMLFSMDKTQSILSYSVIEISAQLLYTCVELWHPLLFLYLKIIIVALFFCMMHHNYNVMLLLFFLLSDKFAHQ